MRPGRHTLTFETGDYKRAIRGHPAGPAKAPIRQGWIVAKGSQQELLLFWTKPFDRARGKNGVGHRPNRFGLIRRANENGFDGGPHTRPCRRARSSTIRVRELWHDEPLHLPSYRSAAEQA